MAESSEHEDFILPQHYSSACLVAAIFPQNGLPEGGAKCAVSGVIYSRDISHSSMPTREWKC